MFYLLIFLSLGQLTQWSVARLFGKIVNPKVLARTPNIFFLGSVIIALFMAGWGMVQALSAPGITRIEINHSRLPLALDGINIIQVSDFHAGAIVGASRMKEIVSQINSLDPDLVLITGDIVDMNESGMTGVLAPLKGLRSRLGVFASAGNHEFIAGIDRSSDLLKKSGVRFLRNEGVVIDDGFLLYGIDDSSAARFGGEMPELQKIIGAEARDKFSILMYHRPWGFEEFSKQGIDIMLSGHTHRGQIWPFRYLIDIMFPRSYGLFRYRNSYLFVSRGVGTWGPPMRVGSPPEIVQLTLYASRSSIEESGPD